MGTKLIEVEVSVETHELGQGLAKMIASVKQALADGWQPGTDLPVIISSAVSDLVPAVQGVDKIGAEMAENKQAFANAVYLGLSPVAFQFVK